MKAKSILEDRIQRLKLPNFYWLNYGGSLFRIRKVSRLGLLQACFQGFKVYF